jgi:hypothetical protein
VFLGRQQQTHDVGERDHPQWPRHLVHCAQRWQVSVRWRDVP